MGQIAMHDDEVKLQAPDLGKHRGGVMRIRRSVIVPAILALSAAGSILAGSAAPAVSTQGASSHVVIMAPHTWFHG